MNSKIFVLCKLIFALSTYLLPAQIFAQTYSISGPSSVYLGSSYLFTFTEVATVPLDCYSWSINPPANGSLETTLPTNQSFNSTTGKYTTTHTVALKFTNTSGATVQVKCNSEVKVSHPVTVIDPRLLPPNGFDINYGCGYTTVKKVGEPDNGVKWWWQTSSTGTDLTLGEVTESNDTFRITSPTDLFLRPRLNTGEWGTSAVVNGGTVPVYNTPWTAPTVANHNALFLGSGNATISVEPVTGTLSYRWYTAEGVSISGQNTNSYTAPFANTQTFYVASVKGCESVTRLPVTITVLQHPRIVVQGGGSTDLTSGGIVLTTGSYTSYAWYDESGGFLGSSRTCSVSTPGKYRVTVYEAGVQGNGFSKEFLVGSELDNNFVATNVVLERNITDPAAADALPIGDKQQTIQYYDGLGRIKQGIIVQGTPAKHDLIQPHTYDQFGREQKTFIPYASEEENGWYKTDAIGEGIGDYSSSPQCNFYQTASNIAQDSSPFAKASFEASPLNRILKQGAVGGAWQPIADPLNMTDHTVKFRYEANRAEDVFLFTYDISTSELHLATSIEERFYLPNQLSVKRIYDEHNSLTMEYSDKLGRLILRRVQATGSQTPVDDTNFASTYYVYDDFGNLVVVIPPEATRRIAQ